MLTRFAAGSGVLLLAPLALALEVPTLLESRSVLGHDWASTLEVANGAASLLVILGAVASCAVGLGWARHGELSTAAPMLRSTLFDLVPAVLVWLTLTLVHLLWLTGVGLAGWGETNGPMDIVPALPIPIAILGGCLVGLVVAYVSGSWLAPPFLGLVLFVGLVGLSGGRLGNLVTLGGIGTALNGTHVRSEIVVGQLFWFGTLGLAAALLLLSLRLGPATRAGAAAVALGACVLAGSGVVTQGRARFELVDLRWECTGADPEYCHLDTVDPPEASVLARLREAHRRWERASREPVPTTYWQRLDLPVAGHAEISFRAGMTDLDLMRQVLSASFPCAHHWRYEQFLLMDTVAESLVQQGLDRPVAAPSRPVRAPFDELACAR